LTIVTCKNRLETAIFTSSGRTLSPRDVQVCRRTTQNQRARCFAIKFEPKFNFLADLLDLLFSNRCVTRQFRGLRRTQIVCSDNRFKDYKLVASGLRSPVPEFLNACTKSRSSSSGRPFCVTINFSRDFTNPSRRLSNVDGSQTYYNDPVVAELYSYFGEGQCTLIDTGDIAPTAEDAAGNGAEILLAECIGELEAAKLHATISEDGVSVTPTRVQWCDTSDGSDQPYCYGIDLGGAPEEEGEAGNVTEETLSP